MLIPRLARTRLARIAIATGSLAALVVANASSPALAGRPAHIAAAPAMGGTLNYRDQATPTCVDPLIAPTSAEGLADFPTFDNLVLLDGKGVARPDLATSWKFTHGGRWITFKLRRGVKFSNGNPLDASVIKFNMLRVLGPVGQAAGMSTFLGPLKSVRVDSKYQVTLVMGAPFRPVLPNLANDSLGIVDPIALKKVGKTKYCQYPIGNGPFKIQNYASGGSQITLVRNPLHNWNTSWASNKGVAYLNKMVIKPIASDSTAVSELLSGGVDISAVAGSQLSRIQGTSGIKQYRVLGTREAWLGFNTAHAPFDNPEVRKAISEAVDRNALIKAALGGLGEPAYSPLGSNLLYYDTASKKLAPQYNPADAQRILGANHVTGPYTLLSGNPPTTTAADELIQAELSAVGVKVSIVSKPVPDYISLAQKGNFDLRLDSFYSPDADGLYTFFHSSQESGGGLNFTFYKNASLDHQLVVGRTTFDARKAFAAYRTVQRFILKNTIVDPLWIPVTVYGVRTRVHGFHTDVTGLWPLFQDLYLSK